MQLISLLCYAITAAAATDVISARVYSKINLKGSYKDVHGFGCVNITPSTFKVESIHLRHQTFCYLYPAKNCKGSSIYTTRDVDDLRLDPTHSIHCFDNSN
ncbi:hypothetical protein NW765_007264 [Fusarium oxysporum]|uniref:Uncharacterized protein n=2 Tax=Fusarium oxysporum TaxID=5507 RepID=A0A2H3HLD0_FUSOX|nr:hypothetical protein NW765_007264 [Fusarium oxysporum]PCD42860.1 hypothetical protein AU210_005385 [Fusarium oxysporum f. sp. radicis-cucumerinum]RKK25204.1 hypothetical protein BFJ65_g3112 [Fusarium oxysporum f. sp. cepae]KAJ4277074.1 hypothetical protein NW764_008315 [Fusarium oxysporum]RKK44692.1 hypothetical protein BFJ66_g9435 [Fusarium oxysporum f. sp. cepae]